MENLIIVEIKTNYGKEYFYIISEHKHYINNLTNKKTLDTNDINNLKTLGFKFEVKTKII